MLRGLASFFSVVVIGPLAIAFILSRPVAAASQANEPKPATGGILAPRPIDTQVRYPNRGNGIATVKLKLLVTEAGAVAEVAVAEGVEPFASVAVRAARTWRFSPARFEGEAIAARILFSVHFAPPEQRAPNGVTLPSELARTPPPPPRVSPTEITPAEATPTKMQHVIVEGKPLQSPDRSISREESKRLPGALGDPLRTIESLPGVSTVVSGLPLFFVRGSPPGNIGFVVDGVRIPLLYHAFLGPSVIHPNLIERVKLYAGPYPADTGRYAGGLVAVHLAEPASERRAELSARLFDAGAHVESPFDDHRGNAAIAGRYSYSGLLLSQLTAVDLGYWDYQAHISYEVAPHHTLSVLSLGAMDRLGIEDGLSGEESAQTQFHRVDLRYDYETDSGDHTRLAFTYGQDRTQGTNGYVADNLLAARLQWDGSVSRNVQMHVGTDVATDAFSLSLGDSTQSRSDFLELFPTRRDWTIGAYAALTLHPARSVWFSPGLRADNYHSLDLARTSVDPRLDAQFALSEDLSAHHAIGLAHQPPNFFPAIPGVQVGGLKGGLQRSLHTEHSLTWKLPHQLNATVGVYQNLHENLTDPIGTSQSFAFDDQSATQRYLGSGRGIEVHLRRQLTRRWGGLLSYTFSQSRRSSGTLETPSAIDRPHVVNLALSRKLAHWWSLGLRGVLMSGVPGGMPTLEGKRFDGERAPPFLRIDLKAEKRWVLSGKRWWAVNVEILNATLAKEVIRRDCRAAVCENRVVGPITIPSIGLEASL